MKNFRLISSATVAVVTLLLGVNIVFLVRLYGSFEAQARMVVRECLADANLDEVLNRIEWSRGHEEELEYKGQALSQSRGISNDTLYTSVVVEDSLMEVRKTPLAPGTNYSDIMVMEICYGAHETIDPYFPLSLQKLDSIFVKLLDDKNFHPDVATIVALDEDGVLIAGDTLDIAGRDGLDRYECIYNIVNGNRYRAYVSPLTGHVVRQMAGLIVTTLLIIVAIGFAFWYLLHTVVRLRTIEEMKDEFTNNMTHELKTPIAVAYSANDALLNYDGDSEPDKRSRYLRIALDQLSGLGGMVENILSISMERRRTLVLDREPLLIKPFLDDLIEAQRLRSPKPVSFTCDVNPCDLIFETDPVHLANVVNNLIDNALKYSLGSVEIAVTAAPGLLRVADNGIGIPRRSLPLIFDRFYRVASGAHADVRGYGIGLFYVRSIVEKMGGSISVESEEGSGTVFTIMFPGS